MLSCTWHLPFNVPLLSVFSSDSCPITIGYSFVWPSRCWLWWWWWYGKCEIICRYDVLLIWTLFCFFPSLIFGTLYPAYYSYKAVKTKNVKEYVSIRANYYSTDSCATACLSLSKPQCLNWAAYLYVPPTHMCSILISHMECNGTINISFKERSLVLLKSCNFQTKDWEVICAKMSYRQASCCGTEIIISVMILSVPQNTHCQLQNFRKEPVLNPSIYLTHQIFRNNVWAYIPIFDQMEWREMVVAVPWLLYLCPMSRTSWPKAFASV